MTALISTTSKPGAVSAARAPAFWFVRFAWTAEYAMSGSSVWPVESHAGDWRTRAATFHGFRDFLDLAGSTVTASLSSR